MTSTGQAEPIILDTRRTSSSLQNPHKVAYSTNTRRGLRAQSLSHVQLFVTPWAAAHQAPLTMEFPRQEYWSGLPFPTPGGLPNPAIEPKSLASPALAGGFLTVVPPGKSPYKLPNGILIHSLYGAVCLLFCSQDILSVWWVLFIPSILQ